MSTRFMRREAAVIARKRGGRGPPASAIHRMRGGTRNSIAIRMVRIRSRPRARRWGGVLGTLEGSHRVAIEGAGLGSRTLRAPGSPYRAEQALREHAPIVHCIASVEQVAHRAVPPHRLLVGISWQEAEAVAAKGMGTFR